MQDGEPTRKIMSGYRINPPRTGEWRNREPPGETVGFHGGYLTTTTTIIIAAANSQPWVGFAIHDQPHARTK